MNLATLELTPEEQDRARDEIRHIAFEHWCEAGCPLCDPLDFWLPAERNWIETQYVPDRQLAK